MRRTYFVGVEPPATVEASTVEATTVEASAVEAGAVAVPEVENVTPCEKQSSQLVEENGNRGAYDGSASSDSDALSLSEGRACAGGSDALAEGLDEILVCA